MEFKDLLVEHDYYCSESNFDSRKSARVYENWHEFIRNFEGMDVDLNLVFRWDIKEWDSGGFYMQVFIMHQRKGIFNPIHIREVVESDFDSIKSYLQPHYEKLQQLWQPFSNPIQ